MGITLDPDNYIKTPISNSTNIFLAFNNVSHAKLSASNKSGLSSLGMSYSRQDNDAGYVVIF